MESHSPTVHFAGSAPNGVAASAELSGPIIGAAGCFGDFSLGGHGAWFDGLGAVTTRTVARTRRRGQLRMRIEACSAGLIWAGDTASAGFVDISAALGRLNRDVRVPVIVSLSGDTPADVTESVAELAGLGGIVAVELTLAAGGAPPHDTETPERVASFVEAASLGSDLPVFVKLSPWVGTVDAAVAAEESGAAAVVIGHGWPGLFPVEAAHAGGRRRSGSLVGPAIRPLTMRLVADVASAVSIGVIACGGITCTADAKAYLTLGARAVQVGSFLLRDPSAAATIASELSASSE